ncbi:hypothetical protein SAMN05421748_12946 [Paractinoplanes atraurantiacus]|uniref:Uncharacterized protein n=1 Tax=Paractinoplanes atraurantiacus TaxID=1036182 RepID=A0A285K0D9_9ACTN|nr:hypothetical protein SAMN05421748_12946 [Actinoplanes atraurantiacus]
MRVATSKAQPFASRAYWLIVRVSRSMSAGACNQANRWWHLKMVAPVIPIR